MAALKQLQFYLLAVALVATALLIRLPVWSLLGGAVPYITFFPAILLAAYFGGMGPGLIATGISLVAGFLILQPVEEWRIPTTAEAVSAVLFIFTSVFISYVCREFRKARDDAQSQRALLSQTLFSIGDGVIATDEKARITFLNPVAEKLTGWRVADARGRAIQDVFRITKEETGEPADSPVERVLKEGVIVGPADHAVLESKTRNKLPIGHSGAPIRDEHGRIRGSVLVFRDVSEVRASQRQLINTLESITESFYSLDENWRVVYANSAAARSINVRAQELVGRIYWDVFPHLAGTELERNYRAAAAEKQAKHFEFYSGRLQVWFDVHVFPSEGGGISVYFQDITDRRKAEAELRDHEQRLSRLAESNVIGIVFEDAEGNVRYANEELCRIIQCSRDNLVGGMLKLSSLTPEEHRSADERALSEARQRGCCTPYEKEYFRSDGSRVPVYVGFVLLGAARLESVAFIVDLTERKRAVEELQHFTYGATHDLKEPLRMITSYSQLLSRKYAERLDGDAIEFIGYIQSAAQRMRTLIDALIEFSRAGQVKVDLSSRADPGKALSSALLSLRRAIEESKAVITAGPMPPVLAEELPLTQIFQNLVGNAIHYRGSEPVEIRVDARRNGDHCVFSVRDNGLGIAAADHLRIFDAFQRLHGRERSGSGLGLATTKRIVERYGGRIWVESDGPGHGSVFHFMLPVAPHEDSRSVP